MNKMAKKIQNMRLSKNTPSKFSLYLHVHNYQWVSVVDFTSSDDPKPVKTETAPAADPVPQPPKEKQRLVPVPFLFLSPLINPWVTLATPSACYHHFPPETGDHNWLNNHFPVLSCFAAMVTLRFNFKIKMHCWQL